MAVYSKRSGYWPAGAVYVGRPTKWGNPFRKSREEDRMLVLQKYKAWLLAPERKELRNEMRRELRGKDLVCWCAPKRCHAELIEWVANQREE